MRKLSKSVDEYLAAGGWSSSLFLEHARSLFGDREILQRCTFEVGRNVVYIKAGSKLLKAYVHHNGRTNQFLTFTDQAGVEVITFHNTQLTHVIKRFILDYFAESI